MYKQTPFEEITEEQYNQWLKMFDGIDVDFSNLDFSSVEDQRKSELACSGGNCEFV